MTPPESPGGKADFVRVPMADGGECTLLTKLTDGQVLCCICFDYFHRYELEPVADEPGKVWDVCRACAPLAEGNRSSEHPGCL